MDTLIVLINSTIDNTIRHCYIDTAAISIQENIDENKLKGFVKSTVKEMFSYKNDATVFEYIDNVVDEKFKELNSNASK